MSNANFARSYQIVTMFVQDIFFSWYIFEMFQIIHVIVLLPKGIIKVMVWMSINIPSFTFDVIFINGLIS